MTPPLGGAARVSDESTRASSEATSCVRFMCRSPKVEFSSEQSRRMIGRSIDALRQFKVTKEFSDRVYPLYLGGMIHHLIGILLFSSLLSYGAEVYFSPSSDCENRIARAIDESKSEVVVAVYSINNKKIVDALIGAKKRGVKLRVLTDHVQASQKSSKALELLANGVDLRLHSKFKIEHNKFAVYDGKLASTGSFNWTGPAARSNSENCLILDEAPVVAKFKDRFEFLWQKNSADASKARVSKLQHRNAASIRR